jgi:hypothetical protein
MIGLPFAHQRTPRTTYLVEINDKHAYRVAWARLKSLPRAVYTPGNVNFKHSPPNELPKNSASWLNLNYSPAQQPID